MEKRLNLIERVVGLLIEPHKTLKYIGENPDLLGPVIIIFLVNLFAIPIQEYSQDLLERLQVPASRSLMFTAQIFAGYLGWLIIGAIYLAITRVLGGTANFRQLLALSGYIQFIALLGIMVKTPVLAITGNLITFSPAIFLEVQERIYTPLGAMLERFDLLNLYSLFLLGLGFITIARLSLKKTIILMGFFWIWGTIFSVLGAMFL